MAMGAGERTYAANPAELPRGTLVQLFFDGLDRWQKEDALRVRTNGRWRSISARDVEERVRRIALAFPRIGVERGDRVALLSENRPEWALADYAALCYGALDVPIYATLPASQVAYILKDSGARVVFVSSAAQLAKVLEVRSELPSLSRIVVFDDVEVADPGVLTLAQLLDLGAAEEREHGGAFRERALSARADDVATILYTSGTTGAPKGVVLTHNNLYSNVRAAERSFPAGPEDVALSFLPLSHVFQRMVDYFFFARGTTIAYIASFDLVAQGMAEVRPTMVASNPRVYEKLYAAVLSVGGIKRRLVFWARAVGLRWTEAKLSGRTPPLALRFQHALADLLVYRKIRERIGGRLRFFISGSAPLAPEIARFFYAAGIFILEGYGLTETSPVTNVNTPAAFKFGTVGPPIPGTEIQIAADGEILVRGPQVMKGYFNLPQATAEAIDAEGWFHTGDIGELDAEGFLKITDRKKDLIVTAGGKNIAPQPIENLAKRSRYVAEAVMLGDRRPYPVLLVVPNFTNLGRWARAAGVASQEPRELVRDARVQRKVEEEVFQRLEGLARFETPKKIALLFDEFSIERGELTPTLKVRRRVVEEHYRGVIDALYEHPEQVVAE